MERITLPNGMVARTGTISHATLRSCDVLPRIAEWCDFYAHDAYLDILERGRLDDNLQALLDGENIIVHPDDEQWLWDELFDCVRSALPDGYYFGANEGDGSDFGIWPVDND